MRADPLPSSERVTDLMQPKIVAFYFKLTDITEKHIQQA